MVKSSGDEKRGLARYIKKKKLDPLESYVPPVIAARNQLKQAGSIMSKASLVRRFDSLLKLILQQSRIMKSAGYCRG